MVVVAAEELVGPLAGEHDADVPARLARDEPERHCGRVAERVVEVPCDSRQALGELLDIDDDAVMTEP
jgi:hypothetical protein